jgi:class 3 adenylate cyclase
MIELGRLRIDTEASVVDARNKIRGLAGSLGFDSVVIIRLATLVSELCRKAIETREHFQLDVTLDQREGWDGLALIFNDCAGPQLNAIAGTCFDKAQEIHAPDGAVHLFAFQRITDPGFEPSEEFIAQERDRISQLSKADQLLRVILPGPIAEELTARQSVQNRRHDNVAVLFADIVGFTNFCENREPDEVVGHLQDLSLAFESVAVQHDVEKIKTIGDSFMAAAGLTVPSETPVLNCVQCGLEMLKAGRDLSSGWNMRIGIHVGPVIAGIIGHQRFSYDLWGDTVNTASRIESNGKIGAVNLSPQAWNAVADSFTAESIGQVPIKGKGALEIFTIAG